MSNYCFIIIPLLTLLQGIVYLVFAIWGLVMRECSQSTTNILDKPFQFATDLIYLQDQDCGDPNVTVLGVSEAVTLELNWVDAEPIKLRAYIFLILYTIFSIFWIISSLCMVILYGSANFSNKRLVFGSWFIFILAGSIIDVVATVFFAIDIANTSSGAETFKYLGLITDAETLKYLMEFDVHFTTPAIVMTVISSRVVVLWLFNVIGSMYCLCTSYKLAPEPILATSSAFPVTIVVEKEQPNKGYY